MNPLKVVVIGRHYGANTVVRRVESYEGCVVEQVDGGGKARFPDCDLAVVCIRVISHAIYYAARDYYKSVGTPCLYIESGWSEVAHDFENWLQKTRGFVQRVNPQAQVRASAASASHDTAMAKALAKAAAHVSEPAQPEPEEVDTRGPKNHSKRFNRTMAEAIFAALKGGQSNGEIAFTLAQAKIRKNNGRSMNSSDVADYINRHELRLYDDLGQWPAYARSLGLDPDPLPAAPPAPPEPAAPPPVPVTPPPAPEPESTPPVEVVYPTVVATVLPPTHAERMHDLIGKVLACKTIEPVRKLELVEEIHAGVRTTDRQLIPERLDGKFQITEQSIFQPGDRALVVLDKQQAAGIMELLKHVKAFAEEP